MNRNDIPSPVLVTGAGGLIGSAICAELSRIGVPTRALLKPEESAENVEGLEGVSIIRGDVRNAARMTWAARSCRSVIHTAALNTLWHRPAKRFYSINVKGTENVLEAALAAGARRFVFTSSCEVMGRARWDCIRDEHAPLDSRGVGGHYEMSKYMAERKVGEYRGRGLRCTIIRPTAVMGPRDIHTSPPAMLIKAFLRKGIPAYYDAGINVVDSRDVARAHIEALARPVEDETFIVGGYNVRMKELFAELSKASGVPAPTRTVGYRTALAAAAFRSFTSIFTKAHPGITIDGIRTIKHPWFFDSSKAREELGVEPRPLTETVGDAVKWHLEYRDS
jgi:dihydroflavonol-4-reductase